MKKPVVWYPASKAVPGGANPRRDVIVNLEDGTTRFGWHSPSRGAWTLYPADITNDVLWFAKGEPALINVISWTDIGRQHPIKKTQ